MRSLERQLRSQRIQTRVQSTRECVLRRYMYRRCMRAL